MQYLPIFIFTAAAALGESTQKDTSSDFSRLMIIGLDGFGGYYMRNYTDQLPNIQRLISHGYYTFEQRNQMPAMSAPNWSTLLTGMPPSETGINSNDWTITSASPVDGLSDGLPPISGAGAIPPTFKDIVPYMSYGTVYSWDWFLNIFPQNDNPVYNVNCPETDDDCVCDTVLSWIASSSHDHSDQAGLPDISFVYLGSIDETGHAHGWGSDEYYAAARHVDFLIGKLLDSLEAHDLLEDLLIATTADHGGYGKQHGDFNQVNMETPAVYTYLGSDPSKKLINGYISETHSNVHFLPTCLFALGLEVPDYMAAPLDIWSDQGDLSHQGETYDIVTY